MWKFPEIRFTEGPVPSLPLNCCRASELKHNRENEESLAAAEPQPGVPTAKADLPAIILGPPGKKPMQLSDSQTPFSLLMQMHPRDTTERDH